MVVEVEGSFRQARLGSYPARRVVRREVQRQRRFTIINDYFTLITPTLPHLTFNNYKASRRIMASPSHEEGEAFPQSASGGLGFDVSVFRTYLATLLPPGPCPPRRDTRTQADSDQ